MKKLIAIWVAVVAVVFIGGIIAGVISKNKEPDVPPVVQEEVIIGYDENGKPITGMVDQKQTIVNIDGDQYSYNTGAFAGKKFKVEGFEFGLNFKVDEFFESGFSQANTTWFSYADSTVIVNYNPSTRRGLTLNAYSQSYLDITRLNAKPCENFEMPSGIVLGKSTLADVQRVYGVSVLNKTETLSTTKYYIDDSKTTGFFVMYFDENDIFCGIDIGCDIFSD